MQGRSGKVEEHIQAGRRIVSLGESLAHAQHMMATSGEDTYDHTVKQFLRHTDIDVRSEFPTRSLCRLLGLTPCVRALPLQRLMHDDIFKRLHPS